jgi:hypothetical protein
MHTVEMLEEALELVERQGIQVRQEWLDGRGSGICVLKGQTWIFLDLAEPPREQLAAVGECLRGLGPGVAASMSPALRGAIGVRRAA